MNFILVLRATLASLVAAAFIPCAGAAAPPAPEAKGAAPRQLPTAMRDWKGDWDGILKRRTLRVLVVTSKTLYYVDKGVQHGIVYDTFRLFEEETNKALKTKALKFHVAFIPVQRDELLSALVQGRGDVAAANLTVTEERDKVIDFTAPTLEGVSELVITGPRSPAVASIEDLSGKEIYVRKSSSYWEHLESLNARFAKEGKAPVRLKPASENLEDEDMLEMLNAGLIPLMVVDSHKAAFWSKVYKNIKALDGVAVNTGGRIAWAIRENSPQLKDVLDAFIKKHGSGTSFGNSVIKRYMNDPRRLKSATDDAELRKFDQAVELFRKYGSRYEMDYLLMMAQGFQESRLDQNAKSQVGAVGVMQVMPATGKDLGVGDITQMDPNIHAGVKYMRFMINTFFANEPMTDLDKGLFAFASYNAGPGRIRSLRKEAEKRGLDPNRWFKHVELVVAEKIGSETVTYVANIYKYYLAYKLVAEQEQHRREALEAAKKGGG